MILDSLTQAIGSTPMVRLGSLEREAPGVEIWAKLEWFNPGGSVKDRAALGIFRDALERGLLRPGASRRLLDSTSGNTGIAYAWIGAALRVPVALVMPANVSEARKRLTRAFGAEVIVSDPLEQSDGAIRLARELGPGHTIVTILADSGTRYQSKLFNPSFLKEKNLPTPGWLDQ